MPLPRIIAFKALLPASLLRGRSSTTAFRPNISQWSFYHSRGWSIARGFISSSPARDADSQHKPRPSNRPLEGRLASPQPETVNNSSRAVIISALPHDVSVTEVLESIARTAPVGAISSAFLLPRPPRRVYDSKAAAQGPPARDNMLGPAVKVNFNQRGSALRLIRLAREKVFQVRNKTPYVSEDRKGFLRSGDTKLLPLSQYNQTRVLILEGAPNVKGFDEATIRQLLRSDATAMHHARSLGDLSESVITKTVDNGQRRMEWRFFSYSDQALPFKKVIKAHFGNRLSVRHGRDPCCPLKLWEAERRRNQGHSKALSGAKKRQEYSENPTWTSGMEGVSESLESPTEASKLATEHIQK